MFKFRIIGFILLMALLGGIFFWKAGGFWLFLPITLVMVLAPIVYSGLLYRKGI